MRLSGPGGAPVDLDRRALPKLSAAQGRALREPPTASAALLTATAAVADGPLLQKRLGLPFGALIQPLSSEPTTIELADDPRTGAPAAVVRCSGCRGYLNPGVAIHEHRGKYECNLAARQRPAACAAAASRWRAATAAAARWRASSAGRPAAAATQQQPAPRAAPAPGQTHNWEVEYILSESG